MGGLFFLFTSKKFIMAIVTGSIFGKVSGKVGNVVYYDLNGQMVVREYIETINDLNSVPQQNQRAKLQNALILYQYINTFLNKTKPLCSSVESIYNMFLRLTTKWLSTTVLGNAIWIAGNLNGKILGNGNYVTITSTVHDLDGFRVYFNIGAFVWTDDIKIKLFSWQSEGQNAQNIEQSITLEQFNTGVFDFGDLGEFNYYPISYIYKTTGSLCSGIAFID